MLDEKLAAMEPLTVYVEGTAREPFKTANNTTAAHALVEGAGLVNIYADNETAYPERNLEAVITADPDVIVKLCGSGADPAESYAEYAAGLFGVATADEGKVILLNNQVGTTAIGSIISRLYIAKFTYPELLADVDVDAVYRNCVKTSWALPSPAPAYPPVKLWISGQQVSKRNISVSTTASACFWQALRLALFWRSSGR